MEEIYQHLRAAEQELRMAICKASNFKGSIHGELIARDIYRRSVKCLLRIGAMAGRAERYLKH